MGLDVTKRRSAFLEKKILVVELEKEWRRAARLTNLDLSTDTPFDNGLIFGFSLLTFHRELLELSGENLLHVEANSSFADLLRALPGEELVALLEHLQRVLRLSDHRHRGVQKLVQVMRGI